MTLIILSKISESMSLVLLVDLWSLIDLRLVGGIVLKIAYGYDVRETRDPIIEAVDRATDQFSLITSPGAFLVDVFPVLRHFPSWFPGAGFKRSLPEFKKAVNEMADLPFEFVERSMVRIIICIFLLTD